MRCSNSAIGAQLSAEYKRGRWICADNPSAAICILHSSPYIFLLQIRPSPYSTVTHHQMTTGGEKQKASQKVANSRLVPSPAPMAMLLPLLLFSILFLLSAIAVTEVEGGRWCCSKESDTEVASSIRSRGPQQSAQWHWWGWWQCGSTSCSSCSNAGTG